jgi:hypothetical protein
MFDELKTAWQTFLHELDPGVRKEFDREIKARLDGEGYEKLDLS